MGKSHRNGNKNKDKDPYVGPTKTGRRGSSDGSDSSAYDDDMYSTMGSVEVVDDVYDQLVDILDRATERNSKIRMDGLQKMNLVLSAKPVPEFVGRNKDTLMYLCARIDNKTDSEAQLLATLIALITVQVGEEITEDITEPMAQMRRIIMDESRNVLLREVCANCLAIVSRIACSEHEEIAANVKACRFGWANTKATSSTANFIGISLASWALLLLDADDTTINGAIADQPKIVTLLASDQLEVRLAAAEVLAFLHEFMQDTRAGFRFPNCGHVLDLFDEMLSDCSKEKSKKDRKTQRYAIRDLRSFIADEDEAPEVCVKIGRQTLSLDSFGIKMFYDMMCDLLHGGIARQLMHNELLREVFDMGSVPLGTEDSINKQAKLAVHDAAEKHRKQARGKQRDKRSIVY